MGHKKIPFSRTEIFKRVRRHTYINLSDFYTGGWEERLNPKELIRETDKDYGDYFISYSTHTGLVVITPIDYSELLAISELHSIDRIAGMLAEDSLEEVCEHFCVLRYMSDRKENFITIEKEVMTFHICKWERKKRTWVLVSKPCIYGV